LVSKGFILAGGAEGDGGEVGVRLLGGVGFPGASGCSGEWKGNCMAGTSVEQRDKNAYVKRGKNRSLGLLGGKNAEGIICRF